jgi:hypothetical protein
MTEPTTEPTTGKRWLTADHLATEAEMYDDLLSTALRSLAERLAEQRQAAVAQMPPRGFRMMFMPLEALSTPDPIENIYKIRYRQRCLLEALDDPEAPSQLAYEVAPNEPNEDRG